MSTIETSGIEDTKSPSELSQGKRVVLLGLVALLLAVVLAQLGNTVWSAFSSWQGAGELPVSIRTAYEVPTPPSDPSVMDSIGIYAGGFDHANFILSDVDETAHGRLTFSRLLVALITLTIAGFVMALAIRAAMNRTIFPLLMWGSVISGTILIVGSLASDALAASADAIIVSQLTDTGIDLVRTTPFAPNWTVISSGIALLVLGLVLRVAQSNAAELREVI